MKKKFLLPLLSLLCAIFLIACGGESNSDKKSSNTTASEQSEGGSGTGSQGSTHNAGAQGSTHNAGAQGSSLSGQTGPKVTLDAKYLKVLPSHSWGIMKLDFGNLLDKSEILKHADVKELFEKSIAKESNNVKSLLKRIYDNPNKSGINVNHPIYFAITGVGYDYKPARAIATLAICDVEAFEKVLFTFGIKVKEKNGMMYILNDGDEHNAEIAYDANKLVIAVDKYRANIADYLNLSPDLMAVNSKRFEPIFKGNEDAMVALNLKQIVNAVMNENGLSGYKAVVEPFVSDYAMFASLNFAKGSVDFKINSNIPAAYTDVLNKNFKPATKRHFKYIPGHSYAVFNYGVDFKQIDLSAMAKLMNIDPDFVKVANESLRKINGDITLAAWIDGYNFEDNENHQIMIALDCADNSVFEVLKSILVYKMDMEPTEVSKDVYALNINRRLVYNHYTYEYEYERDGYDYYLMYKDGAIMFMPENLYEMLTNQGEFKPLKKNISGNKIFASMPNGLVVDPSPIREILSSRAPRNSRQSREDKIMLDLLRMVNNLIVTFDFINFNASLKLTDGNTNSLKTIVNKFIVLAKQEEERRKDEYRMRTYPDEY